MNARQKRLFEESLKKNPNLKMPVASSQPSGGELTEEDLALLKQGVGDKSGRPQHTATAATGESSEDGSAEAQTGSVMTYFEEKGFGFLRPDGGGKDIFIHVTALRRSGVNLVGPGQRVRVDVVDGRKGLEADKVTLI